MVKHVWIKWNIDLLGYYCGHKTSEPLQRNKNDDDNALTERAGKGNNVVYMEVI